jgi:hypothetical protein
VYEKRKLGIKRPQLELFAHFLAVFIDNPVSFVPAAGVHSVSFECHGHNNFSFKNKKLRLAMRPECSFRMYYLAMSNQHRGKAE